MGELDVVQCPNTSFHAEHLWQRGGEVETKADWARVAIPVQCSGRAPKIPFVNDELGQTWLLDGKWHKALAGFYYRVVKCAPKELGRGNRFAFLYVHNDALGGGSRRLDGWGFDWGWGKTHDEALKNSVDGGSLPTKRQAMRQAEMSLFFSLNGRWPEEKEGL